MAIFEHSPAPDLSRLAVNDPSQTFDDYRYVASGQLTYWARVAEKSTKGSGDRELAATFTVNFGRAADHRAKLIKGEAISDQEAEWARARLIGTVSMSLMARRMRRLGGMTLSSAKDTAEAATLIPDIYDTAAGAPEEARLHIVRDGVENMFPAGETPEQWYRAGNLYVRRTIEAQPTNTLVFTMQIQGFHADFPNMMTLYPYLAVRGYAGPEAPAA